MKNDLIINPNNEPKKIAIFILIIALFVLILSGCARITAKACLEKFPPPQIILVSEKSDTIIKVDSVSKKALDSLTALIKPCPEITIQNTPAKESIKAINESNKKIVAQISRICTDSIKYIQTTKTIILPDSATNRRLKEVSSELDTARIKLKERNNFLLYSLLFYLLSLLGLFFIALKKKA